MSQYLASMSGFLWHEVSYRLRRRSDESQGRKEHPISRSFMWGPFHLESEFRIRFNLASAPANASVSSQCDIPTYP
jgi:hypothetical protein